MANRGKWGDGGWGNGGGWEKHGKTGKEFWEWDPDDPNKVDAEMDELDTPEPKLVQPPLDPNSWPTEPPKQESRRSNNPTQSDPARSTIHPHSVNQGIWELFNQAPQLSGQDNLALQHGSQGPAGTSSSWGADSIGGANSNFHTSFHHSQASIQGMWGQYNQELKSSGHATHLSEYGLQRPSGRSSGWTENVPTTAVLPQSQTGFNRFQSIPSAGTSYSQKSLSSGQQNRPGRDGMMQREVTSSSNWRPRDDIALSAGRLSSYRQALANPVSLLRQTEMAQNPLNSALNLRKTILGTSKDTLMENALKRYRNVREVDPAAAARRELRERNKPKEQPYIPSKKLARKFVGAPANVRPARRVPSPETAITSDSSVVAASRPVQLESSVLRPGWSRSLSSVPIIPLGRDEKDKKATEIASVPDMKHRVEVEEIPAPPDEPEIVEEESISSKDVDVSVDELTTKLFRLDVDRDCSYPNRKSGILDASAWCSSDGEVGWIPQICLCSVETELVKSSGMKKMLSESDVEAVSRGLIAGCSATYRDEKRLLNGCGRPLDSKAKEDLSVQWLPQLGVFGFFCDFHVKLLRQHKICPYCNEFFQSGNKDFVVCRKTKNEVHLFHLDCQVRMDMAQECAHCLADQRACIKEWYDGSDTIATSSKTLHGESNFLEDSDLRDDLQIPDGKGGFFNLEGYVPRAEMKELEALPKKAALCRKEDLKAALPQLSLSVLLSTVAQFPDLLKEKQFNGDSLLHVAARMGKVIAAFFLYKYGLLKNDLNTVGETPLIVAVKNGQRHVIYCLVVEIGVDINKQDNEGRTAFHWAAIQQSSQVMHFLLGNGANRSIKDNLGFAAVFHTLTWIRDVEFYGLAMACIGLTPLDRDGWSLMHWVAFLHRNDLVDNFYDLGLAFVADKWGDTPMHVAVRVGNLEFVKLLLTVRPPLQVMVRNKQGDTPYQLAEQLMEAGGTEVGRIAKDIAAVMRQMMPDRLVAMEGLKTKSPVARGEICGDISRGRNVFPIPCYNFVNSVAYSNKLMYSSSVVRPIIYQNEPVLDSKEMEIAGFTKPCKLSLGATNCESIKCPCMAVKLCPKKRSRVFCSDECRDNDGYHYVSQIIDDCYIPFVENGGPISLPYPGKKKPTPADIRCLKTRLLQQLVLRRELSDDLLHILDLLDCEFPECDQRRRSRSVGRESRLRSLPYTVEGATGKRRLRSRSVDRAKEEGFVASDDFAGEGASIFTASSTSINEREKNRMDLFDELERFQVSFLTQAATCRFERRHPFDRWDLSVVYRNAPRRHLPEKNDRHSEQKPRRLVEETLLAVDDWTALAGCSVKCDCGPDCSNRVLQRPSTARVALVYVNDIVSWGVMALTKISRGQYLTDYTGELINGDLYGNDTYLYEINIPHLLSSSNAKKESNWVVDAKKVGNIGRFFNHSCNPNSKALEVHEHGMTVPRICIVALRTIYPGESVTLNYGDKWWFAKQANEGITCLCCEDSCKFSKLLAQSVEDDDNEDDDDDDSDEE